MSRSVVVRVSESVSRTIHVEDGVQAPLELLPILERDRMAELLAAELEKGGFERDGNTMTRKEKDGIEISVDLETLTVSVKLGAEHKLTKKLEVEHRTYEENEASAQASAKQKVKKDVEELVAKATEDLRKQVTSQLEGRLADVKAELDKAVDTTTVTALTEKAKQLGQVQSVVNDQAGNVTIRVKV